MDHFNNIGITCKSDLNDADIFIPQIIDYFYEKNKNLFIDKRIKKYLSVSKYKKVKFLKKLSKIKSLDLIVTLGGDGTMLRSIQDYLEYTEYFFGINMGHLGFLSELPAKDFKNNCRCILKDKCSIDERTLLKIRIYRKKEIIKEFFALNEIVINQITDVARMINLKTEVNRKKLTTYHADGLIIATPTGSTAYNISVGGPILHPKVEAFIITPINAHSFSQKPIVIPNNKSIFVYNESNRNPLSLTIDGQKRYDLKNNDIIKISKYKKTVKFIRLYEENYFKTLRRKLKWGEKNI